VQVVSQTETRDQRACAVAANAATVRACANCKSFSALLLFTSGLYLENREAVRTCIVCVYRVCLLLCQSRVMTNGYDWRVALNGLNLYRKSIYVLIQHL